MRSSVLGLVLLAASVAACDSPTDPVAPMPVDDGFVASVSAVSPAVQPAGQHDGIVVCEKTVPESHQPLIPEQRTMVRVFRGDECPGGWEPAGSGDPL